MLLGTLFQQPSVSITLRNRSCEPYWFQELLCKQEVVSNTTPGHTMPQMEHQELPACSFPGSEERLD